MSRFILHTKAKGTLRLRYLMMGLACLMTVGIAGYTVHSIGTCLLYTSRIWQRCGSTRETAR